MHEGPTLVIAHLFSGHRREGDVHHSLALLPEQLKRPIRVLSLDTAVHQEVGNLIEAGTTWRFLTEAIQRGAIAGIIAGPPCETFSAARGNTTHATGREARTAPRPLRTAKRPWGIGGLSGRELAQARQGTMFILQTLWAMTMVWNAGGVGILEHPAAPKDIEKVSIFRTPLLRLLLQLPGWTTRTILQHRYGAEAVKPTTFLLVGLEAHVSDLRAMEQELPKPAPCIGKDADGKYRTTKLKAYPARLCSGLARMVASGLQRPHGKVAEVDAATMEWLEEAWTTSKWARPGELRPDYQPGNP